MKTLLACLALAIVAGPALAATQPPAAAGPSNWQVAPVPGAPGACSAKLPGDAIDLILMINNAGKLVLTAGHSDWNASPGQFASTLSVDGHKPTTLEVSGAGPLYLGTPTDKVTAALRKSKTVDWTLPPGSFHVASVGLGAAMDGVVACMKSPQAAAARAGS
ncbi:MAG TPA: hypothetical protein VME40_09195 [Caulobacteraceae bacterium]|nr:hypothetical protein [Caulobacteraceae bacterium]